MAAPLKAGAEVSVAKLIKMLNSASKVKKGKHDPKEMLDEDGEDLSIKDSAEVSVAKLIKMLNSASKVKKGKHDPKEMLDEDGEDLSKDEKVIDEQKLAEQEEIIRRITKKREV